MTTAENKIFAGLNEKQIEAVRAIEGPVLILAGAGSGKTKALTHRIAYMIAGGIAPHNILAITFTNKAAGEIKERVAGLLRALGDRTQGLGANGQTAPLPWMGTFHSICLRILRQDIESLGYSARFVIYDEEDQTSLIKQIMQDLELDTKKFNPKIMLNRISKLKSELTGHRQFERSAHEYLEKVLASIYSGYQAALKKNNALDFDDLLMLCVELFDKKPEVMTKYQDLFRYILVDEYQDTNPAQYAWVSRLAKKRRNLFVIGDDYQSIYNFRQADIRNILDFEKDYPDARIIMLEQNYRSTQTILAAANKVILNNRDQKHKKLWTDNAAGEKIYLKELGDERDEGQYIIRVIREGLERGRALDDFTILYRAHAQSRSIEEAIIKRGFPYRIIGGVKFYQRREVKDILAYLRLALNPNDMVSLDRIYNVPARGIGRTSFDKFRESLPADYQSSISIFEHLKKDIGLGKKQTASFAELAGMLGDFGAKAVRLGPSDLIRHILKKIDYEKHIKDGTEEGEERWENVKELFTATAKYDLPKFFGEKFGQVSSEDENNIPPRGIERFLEEVALIQETDKLNQRDRVINLMTIHSAKGLEFPVVILVGMEDGVFPHSRALFNPQELEEERRLCYVAITRAKERLHLTFCRERRLYGSTQANLPSRFLFEIPENLVDYAPVNQRKYGQAREDEFADY